MSKRHTSIIVSLSQESYNKFMITYIPEVRHYKDGGQSLGKNGFKRARMNMRSDIVIRK